MFARTRSHGLPALMPMIPLTALMALMTLSAGAFAAGPAADAGARYDAARDQYEIGHFQAAFDEFAALADDGHCEAARVARQMVRHGRALYAVAFTVAPERLERWQRLPGCNAAAAAAR